MIVISQKVLKNFVPDKLYGQPQAQLGLGISRSSFLKLVKQGAIEFVIKGHRKKFRGDAILRFINSLPNDPVAIVRQ